MSEARISTATKLLIAGIAGFVLFFGTANWLRQVNLVTAQFDMGNMDQVLWHSLHGDWFKMGDPGGPQLQLRTAIHADYLLLAYLPFYAIWPDPRVPLVLQVMAVASAALPLFWLARRKLGEKPALLLGVIYLAYPALHWATIFDVHAVVLTTPIFIWAWWAMTQKRWWLYGLLAVAAVLAKEEIGLVVAAMGIYWVFKKDHRRAAIASIVGGVGWAIFATQIAIPEARGGSAHFALEYFSTYGDSYSEILSTMFAAPWRIFADMAHNNAWGLLKQLLTPVAGLAVLGLPIFAVALPELALNLLSSNPGQHGIFFQYMSAVTPFVFLAAISGWVALRALGSRFSDHVRKIVNVAVWLALCAGAVFSVYQWAPLPWAKNEAVIRRIFRNSPYRADVRIAQTIIRPEDRVAATNNLVPQFSRREFIWSFPLRLEDADVVAVLQGGGFDILPKEQIDLAVLELAENPMFTLAYHRDQFWVFRKTSSGGI